MFEEKAFPTDSMQVSSALAFAALTAIWINSQDVLIVTLALTLSLLVVGNRIQNNARTRAEVMTLLGIK